MGSGADRMHFEWPLGPVFVAECLMSARRWQVYAGRVLLVGGVLMGLIVIWYSRFHSTTMTTLNDLAELGRAFTNTILAVELVLVLVVVPAATAGAFCQDRMRGGLATMMATELSDAEIVLGKLASSLVLVLGVIACGFPVLAIATMLGGADPLAILGGTMVIVGVAILGVCVSSTFSVWASRPHDALMATYATWAIWLLTLLVWTECCTAGVHALGAVREQSVLALPGVKLVWPDFLPEHTAPRLFPNRVTGGLGLAGRDRQPSHQVRDPGPSEQLARPSAWRSCARPSWFRYLGLPTPSLDVNPVLWREWNRRHGSAWTRAIWTLGAWLTWLFIILAVFVNENISAGTGGFAVCLGLILVIVTATTALAEERAGDGIEVLLSTPLSAREILLGKWWGAYRIVPGIAVIPAVISLGLGITRARLALAAALARPAPRGRHGVWCHADQPWPGDCHQATSPRARGGGGHVHVLDTAGHPAHHCPRLRDRAAAFLIRTAGRQSLLPGLCTVGGACLGTIWMGKRDCLLTRGLDRPVQPDGNLAVSPNCLPF